MNTTFKGNHMLDREKMFMEGLLKEFSASVLAAMSEGHHDNFDDHHAFLAACMETFINELDDTAS